MGTREDSRVYRAGMLFKDGEGLTWVATSVMNFRSPVHKQLRIITDSQLLIPTQQFVPERSTVCVRAQPNREERFREILTRNLQLSTLAAYHGADPG